MPGSMPDRCGSGRVRAAWRLSLWSRSEMRWASSSTSARRPTSALHSRRSRKSCARDAPRSTRGWGPSYVERVHKKGKLTARERLDKLADPGTRTFEVGTFVNYGEVFPGDQKSPAAGVVTAFARVEGRWCMVIANDNTVASGAWWPRTPEKIQRAQMMALRLRLPTIYLVDCSGLFLPEQSKSLPGRDAAPATSSR